jgi:hypothetical protein
MKKQSTANVKNTSFLAPETEVHFAADAEDMMI